jgi:hypothetical protein
MKSQYLYDLFMELLPNFYEPSANVEPWQWLSATGSVLLFLTIPLIILAACCLDWMEKDKPGIRSKNRRQEYERTTIASD